MANIKVKIEGLDGFIEGLKKYPEFTVGELNTAVTHSIQLLYNTAIKEAPVNKQPGGGNLRQLIHSRMTTRISGEVSADASYSIFVEEGTRPHEIRPLSKGGLANERTGQFFGKLVRHPGTKPNPFMKRAVDKVTPRVNELFLEGLNNVLNKIASLAR